MPLGGLSRVSVYAGRLPETRQAVEVGRGWPTWLTLGRDYAEGIFDTDHGLDIGPENV